MGSTKCKLRLRAPAALHSPCFACRQGHAVRGVPARRREGSLELRVFPPRARALPPVLRVAVPASLAYRPKPSWLGRSPGQQSTGLLSFSGSRCCAWRAGEIPPWISRSPGRVSTGHSSRRNHGHLRAPATISGEKIGLAIRCVLFPPPRVVAPGRSRACRAAAVRLGTPLLSAPVRILVSCCCGCFLLHCSTPCEL